jgi:S-adenosylmethionine:tRNA ribosyltransferase-isomerase
MFSIDDFDYVLEDSRIAKFPLDPRDSSKLIFYNGGEIRHYTFRDLPRLLPERTMLVFNDTKVIPARLSFFRDSGARIEVFLLEPVWPSHIMQLAMEIGSPVRWKCLIGNLKRWNEDEVLHLKLQTPEFDIELKARLTDRQKMLVDFEWTPAELPQSQWIEATGDLPIPPYLKRETTSKDYQDYQTVYSKNKGAVAAPTAGLHFTDRVFSELDLNGFKKSFLTLHVGAGTFLPVKVENIADHTMHEEQIVVKASDIQGLIDHKGPIIPVGTTSLRTLESMYWLGLKAYLGENPELVLDKNFPYRGDLPTIDYKDAYRALIQFLEKEEKTVLHAETGIFIYPGYSFKVVRGLITNFHQPKSTLIMLVAAIMGKDWLRLYQTALENDYRFLSYGDSSLILPAVD